MNDRWTIEDIINGLEAMILSTKFIEHDFNGVVNVEVCEQAIDLLKAQKPKFVPDIAEAIIGCKPKVKVGHCPSCDVLMYETDKFCRKCGQAVKWDV